MPEGPDGEYDETRQRVSAGVHAAFPGEMVTRWLAVIEVLGQAGDRAMYVLSANDMQAWDTLGMVRYVEALQQARLILDEGFDER